jgi:hypothetical protein
MDMIAAYRDVGSYRGAAAICGTTHKTVKRIIERHQAGGVAVEKTPRVRNYDEVTDLVAKRVKDTSRRRAARSDRRWGRDDLRMGAKPSGNPAQQPPAAQARVMQENGEHAIRG